METYAAALALAVQELEMAEAEVTRCRSERELADQRLQLAAEEEDELRELVAILNAVVTGVKKDKVPL